MHSNYFKYSHLPYMKHGKWQKFFIESTTEDGYVLTQSTIEGAEIEGRYLKLPPHYHIIDSKYDITNLVDDSGVMPLTIRGYGDESQGVILPLAGSFDSCEIHIFANYEV